MKIKEYMVVCEKDFQALIDAVNKLIKDGYQPFGNFQAVHTFFENKRKGPMETINAYYQPMVKYE